MAAVALTGFAPPAAVLPCSNIEAEPPRLVAANLGVRQPGEQGSDLVENFDVGSRVGSRGPPDRRLVDVDDLVEMFDPLDPIM